jgi:hypothetical protein
MCLCGVGLYRTDNHSTNWFQPDIGREAMKQPDLPILEPFTAELPDQILGANTVTPVNLAELTRRTAVLHIVLPAIFVSGMVRYL